MTTRGRKLRKTWRIPEEENSVAGAVQTLRLRTAAQIRRRRCCLQVKEQRPRKEAMTWEQMLDLGGRGLRRQELIAAEGIY